MLMAAPLARSSAAGKPESPGIPRAVEAAAAAVGLVISLPLLAVAGVAVAASSAGPVLFRQERVGRHGKRFWLYKLRTMRLASEGPLVTVAGDDRITPIGRFLRRCKLDELPQLWNVVRGDMSLVGPRPEVPRYVDVENPLWQRILRVRPGITDPVTLTLRDEEDLLAAAPGDPERYYREQLQPVKLREYGSYLERRDWKTDLRVLSDTLRALATPRRRSAGSERKR